MCVDLESLLMQDGMLASEKRARSQLSQEMAEGTLGKGQGWREFYLQGAVVSDSTVEGCQWWEMCSQREEAQGGRG